MSLDIYYTSKGRDSCAMSQEYSQSQGGENDVYSAQLQCNSLEIN